MCMALFAMSFVHFGLGHGHEAWSSELFLHHAGIPVALFLLLQDYRFVLLDAFIRFAANGVLAALLSWAAMQAVRWAFGVPAGEDPLRQAGLLAGLSMLLVLFASMRGAVQRWIAHALFRQGGVARLPQTVKAAPPFADEASYLDWAAREMASAVRAGKYAILPHEAERPDWAEASIPVRLGPGQAKWIALGPRPGGQRYLGEDIESLTRAAAEIEERAEALRRQEMDRLMNQAELRALQSQINPHFLFNALNALYGSIPREAAGARRLVLHLADIFRYFLQSDKGFVTVAEEMQIVRAYLDVEKFRLGDRLQLEIAIDPAALEARIPALSVQPLVENAIRHGIARRTEPGFLRITAECRGDELRIAIVNSGAGASNDAGFGMGLQNVRRRLEICYGASAELELRFEDSRGPRRGPPAGEGSRYGRYNRLTDETSPPSHPRYPRRAGPLGRHLDHRPNDGADRPAAGQRAAGLRRSDDPHDRAHQHPREACPRSTVARARRRAREARDGAHRAPRQGVGDRRGFGPRADVQR